MNLLLAAAIIHVSLFGFMVFEWYADGCMCRHVHGGLRGSIFVVELQTSCDAV